MCPMCPLITLAVHPGHSLVTSPPLVGLAGEVLSNCAMLPGGSGRQRDSCLCEHSVARVTGGFIPLFSSQHPPNSTHLQRQHSASPPPPLQNPFPKTLPVSVPKRQRENFELLK